MHSASAPPLECDFPRRPLSVISSTGITMCYGRLEAVPPSNHFSITGDGAGDMPDGWNHDHGLLDDV